MADVVQRAFLACVEAQRAGRAIEHPRGFLYAVARHELYDRLRARWRLSAGFDPAVSSLRALGTSPTSRLARDDRHAWLLDALERLPLDANADLPRMKRSIAAIFAGYLTMVVIVTGSIGCLSLVFAGHFGDPTTPFRGPAIVLWAELAMSVVAATVGGYVCAWVARRAVVRHAQVLMGIMLAFGALTIVTDAGLKPRWSTVAIVVLSPLGVLLGAWLRARYSNPRDPRGPERSR